jgi:hypothetical protein
MTPNIITDSDNTDNDEENMDHQIEDYSELSGKG